MQEEGTEAAAATIVEIEITSSQESGFLIHYKVDRIFFYMIIENSTAAIVFMGKVEKS